MPTALLIEILLRVARTYLFVREVGHNAGVAVGAIQRSTGNKAGDPWCASFVFFIARAVFGTRWPLPRTASCDVLLEYAKKHGLLVTSRPEVGDVFLVLKTPHDATHTGFVAAVAPAEFETIEGNTNAQGARDGNGVFERTRPLTAGVYVFIRWPRALAA